MLHKIKAIMKTNTTKPFIALCFAAIMVLLNSCQSGYGCGNGTYALKEYKKQFHSQTTKDNKPYKNYKVI